MRVTILGSGIIGLSTAYFLAKGGHRVTVVDKNAFSALESSFANGGQLSYSHATPWSTFGNIVKALKWVRQKDAPLLFRPSLDLDMYKWLMRFVYNALPYKVNENTLKILTIDFYSRKVLHDHIAEFDFDFSYKQSGILHIFDTEQDRENALKYFDFEIHQHREIEFKKMSSQEVVEFEPSLEASMEHHYTGLFFPKDEIGDAHKFCKGLEEKCKRLGVNFQYKEVVRNLIVNSERVSAVETDKGMYESEVVIVAMGAYSGVLLKKIGLHLPIYPMKGYSVSFQSDAGHIMPKVSITHSRRKIVITPLGSILRVVGTAELAGYNHDILEERIQPLVNEAIEVLPRSADFTKVTKFVCLRPQTPSCVPIICKSPLVNLYINSGHGSLGWTQGIGSGKLMGDIVQGNKPEINSDLFDYFAG